MATPIVTGEACTYCLLELPPELEAALESGGDAALCFNGRLSDEAALITHDATYAVRQVLQSNTLLVCSLEEHGDGAALRLRDKVHDTLEVVRVSANLDRLASLNDRRYTYAEMRSITQASEAEFAHGLRMHHIMHVDGFLRRIEPDVVLDLLQSMLAQLDVLACSPEHIPFERMCEALAPRASRAVAEAVVGDWFCASRTADGRFVGMARAHVAQFIGLRLLEQHRRMALPAFLDTWRRHVGALHGDAHLSLLQVRQYYLCTGSLSTIPGARLVDADESARADADGALGARPRRYPHDPVVHTHASADRASAAVPGAVSDAHAVAA